MFEFWFVILLDDEMISNYRLYCYVKERESEAIKREVLIKIYLVKQV